MNMLAFLPDIPWWGGLVVIAAIIGFVFWSRSFLRGRFDQIIHEAVLEAGSALKDAESTVHSVTAVPAPNSPSPYDLKEDDEEFCDEVDGQPWDDDGANYYSIDVTVTPADPAAKWDPTALAMVPADFEPEDPMFVSEKLCGLHSAERFINGRWEPMPEKEVRGPLRLKLLMGVPDGLRAAKFANLVTYFGHVDLPAPAPKTRRARV